MQESIKRILSETLTTIKTKIGKLDSSHYQKFYRHKREENNGWSSTPEDRVNINAVYSHKNINWENESRKFGESFFREYPNYHNKIQRIGTELGAYTSFEPYLIVRSMAGALYRSKTHPVKITNREINSIVEQFSIFMDNPKIKIQCIAPLAGFYANGIKKHITVKKGLTIRKFSNQEINDLFTDTHYSMSPMNFQNGYALVKDHELTKIFPKTKENPTPSNAIEIERDLDRALLALRTFKSGMTELTGVIFKPTIFCPLSLGSWRNHGINYNQYTISKEEVGAFRKHSKLIFEKLHRTLEIACTRLSEAELRQNPFDKFLDAAIGLEALLLSNKSEEKKYKGEVRFRFSMHYGSLFKSPKDRHDKYLEARNLYDYRSEIVHGGKLETDEAAIKNSKNAVEMLRKIIKTFLSKGSNPEYLKDNFWTKKLFNLTEL